MLEGQLVDGVEVAPTESKEYWNEFKLEDGAVLRLKLTVGSIVRVIGRYDPEGMPVYVVKATTAMVIPSVPENLRRKQV
jgi:hypothetical protein